MFWVRTQLLLFLYSYSLYTDFMGGRGPRLCPEWIDPAQDFPKHLSPFFSKSECPNSIPIHGPQWSCWELGRAVDSRVGEEKTA